MSAGKPIVVVGSVNADHVLKVPRLPAPGETVSGRGYQVLGGGKGANQAVAAARLGGDIRFVADVGDDEVGKTMRTAFATDGIDTSYIRSIDDTPTGCAMIFVDDAGENCIGIEPGANAALDVDRIKACADAFTGADSLLVQLETPIASVERALQLANEAGVRCVLNPAPARPLDSSLLALVDIITPNETEAELLTGIAVSDERSAARAASRFHDAGIGCAIITLGARGAFVSVRNADTEESELVAPPAVDVVDTTAAGDTFNGALVAELARGSALLDAVRFANRAAAISVTRFGAQPSIPTLEELLLK